MCHSREWWNERLHLIKAYAEGKNVEVNVANRDNPHAFTPVTLPDFGCDVSDYRIAPEPKLRPWKPEEVPVGAVFRWPQGLQKLRTRFLITEVDECNVFFGSRYSTSFSEMVTLNGEHSIDGGKTWAPCGILE
jgi:hypothetical protein